MTRPPLLFFVGAAGNPHAAPLIAALARLAADANVAFDCCLDRRRIAGIDHAEHVLWLATEYDIAAVGDAGSPLWPALEAAGAVVLSRTTDPAAVYAAVLERLWAEAPADVLVLDAGTQGPGRITTAPYVVPAFFTGEPVLGIDVSGDEHLRAAIERLGAKTFRGLYVAPERGDRFPGGLDVCEGDLAGDDYARFTSRLAHEQRAWGQGILWGGPAVVTAQIPKLARLRLLPLHGNPPNDCLARCGELVRHAREPLYADPAGDHDVFALGRLGHGLQTIDPDPPFDAAVAVRPRFADPPGRVVDTEPSDEQLAAWADDGRVLVSLLFWAGMLRDVGSVTRVLDLVAATGLRGGLVLTAETIEHGGTNPFARLAVDPERGGTFGMLEPLLASTGRGIAAEGVMSAPVLGERLREAAQSLARSLPSQLVPRGWWPLFDTALAHRRTPVTWRDGRPVLTGGWPSVVADAPRTGLGRIFGDPRSYDRAKPGRFVASIAAAVQTAGLTYMWTMAGFGAPQVVHRNGDFVALSFTAGRWNGAPPFSTVASSVELRHAERRLLRRSEPGWLVSTVDPSSSPAAGDQMWEDGLRLHELVSEAARGGLSGELVNTTPHVVARYARLLDDRRRLRS